MKKIFVVLLWVALWVAAILMDGLTQASSGTMLVLFFPGMFYVFETSLRLLHNHGIWSVIRTRKEKLAFIIAFTTFLMVLGMYADRPKSESLLICRIPTVIVAGVALGFAWYGLTRVVPDYCYRVVRMSTHPELNSGE